MNKTIVAVCVLFSSVVCAGIDKQQIEIQHAGMTGTVHVSYGIRVFDDHVFSIGAGMVNESSSHDDMEIYSLKYRYNFETRVPFKLFNRVVEWQVASLSVTGIQGNDDNLYASLPDKIPDGYYLPTANRIVFGVQSTIHLNSKYQVYWDWSVLDVGLINLVRNYDFYRDNYKFAGLAGVVTYGIGMRVEL
ncbi:MAG: hypothetical protein HWE10_00660 [Gammaproteobacteria bacterium]|nr:hypothetical protein [Gammaproteobacteria bacterium]